MSNAGENAGRLETLLSALLDGELTDEQTAELRRRLRDDPAALREYFRRVSTHVMLELSYGSPDILAAESPAAGDGGDGNRGTAVGEVPGEVSLPGGPLSFISAPSAWLPLGGVLLSYLVAALLLGGGLMVARAWKMPAKIQLVSNTPSPAIPKQAELAGDSTSGRPRTLHRGDHVSMEGLVGKEISNEVLGGESQIAYNPGTSVSLLGPFGFCIPTDTSGAMQYGRSTVRVEKGYNFTLSLPSVQVTCHGGEFGVELDRRGDGWIQVFGGAVAVRLESSGYGGITWQGIQGAGGAVPVQVLDRGVEATRMSRTMSLGANESLRIRQRDGVCVATAIRDAQLAASLAGRMPPRLPPPSGGKEPMRVASAQEHDAVAMPGNAVSGAPAAGDGSSLLLVSMQTQDGPFDPARPTSQIVTARFSLSELAPHEKLEELVPGRKMLRLRFAVRRFVISAMRLNGKSVPLPEEPLAGTVRQIGAVTLRDGFLGGNGVNVLEIDVRSLEPGQALPEQINGTDGPIVLTAEVILVPRPKQAKTAGNK
jgi:hypothetical protein